MRFALLTSTSLVALALASYACSSSDDKATGTADAGKATSSSTSSSGDDDDNSSSSGESSSGSSGGTSSGSTTSSSGDAGTTSSSGTTTSSSGTITDGGTEAGTLCLTTSIQETDANNGTSATAQVLAETNGAAKFSFCGRAKSSGDTDFWTYTPKAPAGSWKYSSGAAFSVGAADKPKVTVTVDGKDYDYATEKFPLVLGKPILFKIEATKETDYRFDFEVSAN